MPAYPNASLPLAVADGMNYLVRVLNEPQSGRAVRIDSLRLYRSWQRLGRVLLHIVLPLGVGSLIYILWRTPMLRVFRWSDALGIATGVFRLRHLFAPYGKILPAWALFNLPAALWMYAMAAWFELALLGSDRRYRWIWLSIALCLGVGSELGQLCHVVPGTFDGKDVAFYLAGWIAAIICTPKKEISC